MGGLETAIVRIPYILEVTIFRLPPEFNDYLDTAEWGDVLHVEEDKGAGEWGSSQRLRGQG